jgi:hypothetical protein
MPSKTDTAAKRRKLKIRGAPYYERIAPGISLGYRRNEGPGAWNVLVTKPARWLKKIGVADDLEPASPPLILSYHQACEEARRLARRAPGTAVDEHRPITVDEALAAYERDLTARSANSYNARYPRKHLTAALLAKPVQLLSSRELQTWRDSLVMKPITANRLMGCIVAALNLAAQHDGRIRANQQAWEAGLQQFPDAVEARNVILSDQVVRELVAAAYRRDAKLGEYTQVLSESGARPGQAARLLVADLGDNSAQPLLFMPKSGKGGGRNRSQRRRDRYPLPISHGLYVRLRQAAAGRDQNELLLLQSDGRSWGHEAGDQPSKFYADAIREIVASLQLSPEITMYALRHSSIVRQLLQNIPVRVVAVSHDTSVAIIEQHYSRHIASHSIALSRAALLDHDTPPEADNVVTLVR